MSTLHKNNNFEMVTEFIDEFIANLIYAFGFKTFKVKFLFSAMFTIMVSPLVYVLDFVKDFLIPERYFFQTIVFLCLADAAMGIGKAFKLGKFNPLLLVIGLATKLGVSYIALQIFQAISSPPELIGNPDFRNYFVLTWKILIMTYPSLSAFNNMYYVTDGRFPSKWWMKRQANFEEDGDIDKLLGKKQDEKE